MTFAFIPVLHAQEKDSALQKIIESKRFVFRAQSASPQRSGTKQLTSEYDVKLLGDSIISYLPYFGRAYSAPMGTGGGGIQFTSSQFTYSNKKKNKGWDITITPKDAGDVRQLFFSISNSGYARLQVTSNNREPISFNGIIESLKPL